MCVYSEISDTELAGMLATIISHPNDGERLGHLQHLGVTVPRARVRASIHHIDPVTNSLRRSITIRRHVSGPWHIDGS